MLKKVKIYKNIISTGQFLAFRQIKRANIWTNLLIIVVMTLTFLNLTVVSGVLVGLIQASSDANKKHYAGDIIISTLPNKNYVENSTRIISLIKSLPEVKAVSARYVEAGRVEAGYKERTKINDNLDYTSALVQGIDPDAEDAVTEIKSLVVEGEFLNKFDDDGIVIGGNLFFKYSPVESPGFRNLKTVGVGDKVRLVVGGNTKEVVIKGVLKSKVGEIDQRMFVLDSVLRPMIGRGDLNVDEIVLKVKEDNKERNINKVYNILVSEGHKEFAKVQTAEDSEPKFLKDIKVAFSMLGNIIGSIGLVVASITIFIVIFVNAITRRKYIGILKGVGIDSRAIEVAYVLQAFFYAFVGTFFGLIILYFVLIPYVDKHPINFPFSNGILVAPFDATVYKIIALFIATLIAGYLPAKIVSRQNTLDAILGR